MGKRYGMVINLKRCVGCHTCTVACKAEHGIKDGSWIKVLTVGGNSMDTPAGVYPDLSMYYLPKLCMHCEKARCIDTCPNGALCRREDGIVVVDIQQCDGCRLCIDACPYDAIFYDEEQESIGKCTFCFERVDQGMEPFCVTCCGMRAMFFGDLNDPESQVSRLIQENGAYPLQSGSEMGLSVFYFPNVGKLQFSQQSPG